jgi:hypothetical protein
MEPWFELSVDTPAEMAVVMEAEAAGLPFPELGRPRIGWKLLLSGHRSFLIYDHGVAYVPAEDRPADAIFIPLDHLWAFDAAKTYTAGYLEVDDDRTIFLAYHELGDYLPYTCSALLRVDVSEDMRTVTARPWPRPGSSVSSIVGQTAPKLTVVGPLVVVALDRGEPPSDDPERRVDIEVYVRATDELVYSTRGREERVVDMMVFPLAASREGWGEQRWYLRIFSREPSLVGRPEELLELLPAVEETGRVRHVVTARGGMRVFAPWGIASVDVACDGMRHLIDLRRVDASGKPLLLDTVQHRPGTFLLARGALGNVPTAIMMAPLGAVSREEAEVWWVVPRPPSASDHASSSPSEVPAGARPEATVSTSSSRRSSASEGTVDAASGSVEHGVGVEVFGPSGVSAAPLGHDEVIVPRDTSGVAAHRTAAVAVAAEVVECVDDSA